MADGVHSGTSDYNAPDDRNGIVHQYQNERCLD